MKKSKENPVFLMEEITDAKIIIKARGEWWAIRPREDVDKAAATDIRVITVKVGIMPSHVVVTPSLNALGSTIKKIKGDGNEKNIQ